MNFKLPAFLLASFIFANNASIKPTKFFSMDQRLTIITLGVINLKTLTDFYEGSFGWEKAASSNADISFFHLNGSELALFNKDELAKDAGVPGVGSGFIPSHWPTTPAVKRR
jgi:hypothetical protein